MVWFRGQPKEALPPVMPPENPTSRSEQDYLRRVLGESRRVLDQDLDGFELVDRNVRQGFRVFRKPVERGKGLTLVRLEAEVPMAPDKLFSLMTSMDGKCIIDPFPREQHSVPVKALRLPQGEASVVFSEAPRFFGLLRPREYVTCDAAATGERLFVCKSCEVSEGPHAVTRKGAVRANLLFAMRMGPVEGRPGCCRMQMVNWLDLGRDTVPPWLANTITERWFFQGVVRRLHKHMATHRLIADPAACVVDKRGGC